MEKIKDVAARFAGLSEVEAVALGGSRAGLNHDDNSDYDVYVYYSVPIEEYIRKEILESYCSVMEIGNWYWEYEDDCMLKTGDGLDVIYRNLDEFSGELSKIVEGYQAANGYSTCLWDNLLNCQIIYDEYGRLERAKKRFMVPYPDKLRKNIIRRNWSLINDNLLSYSRQIKRAVLRNDRVSMLNRTSGFLDSYFDILFALNRMTHPGEKRMVEFCKKNCTRLPKDFEENLNRLFDDMYVYPDKVNEDIQKIITELRKILVLRNSLVFR